MIAEAEVCFVCLSKKHSKIIFSALKPEVDKNITPRSKTIIDLKLHFRERKKFGQQVSGH